MLRTIHLWSVRSNFPTGALTRGAGQHNPTPLEERQREVSVHPNVRLAVRGREEWPFVPVLVPRLKVSGLVAFPAGRQGSSLACDDSGTVIDNSTRKDGSVRSLRLGQR
jgi:hypothetical protein